MKTRRQQTGWIVNAKEPLKTGLYMRCVPGRMRVVDAVKLEVRIYPTYYAAKEQADQSNREAPELHARIAAMLESDEM